MRKTLLLAVLSSAFVAEPARAQAATDEGTASTHRGVVSAQLDRAVQVKRAEGFSVERAMDPQTVFGLLPDKGTVALEITLRAGVEYFIIGSCDSDCEDLDLRVRAPGDDTPLAQDIEDDDVPLLLFTAKQSGAHMLTLTMADCDTSACYFGVRVLGKK